MKGANKGLPPRIETGVSVKREKKMSVYKFRQQDFLGWGKRELILTPKWLNQQKSLHISVTPITKAEAVCDLIYFPYWLRQ